jgi:hypothetical protein
MEYKEIENIDVSTYAGKAAAAVKVKARGIMGDDLLIFHLLDLVKFVILNNEFASKGIYITDDNREESYIKIIEMGDETLIEKLEDYLNTKDAINVIQRQKDEYKEIITKLQELEDKNDETTVNSIVEEYLRR